MKRRAKATEQDETHESDLSSEDEGTAPVLKKKRYQQKFLNSWLTESQFKHWLVKRSDAPYCKVCNCSLYKKHKNMCQIQDQVSAPINSLLVTQANPATMEKNLPISIVEDLVPLLRSLFPSDPALREVRLGKQKATNVIRQVLGFHAMKECVRKLKENKFSLIIDETTDKSTTSQLAILGVFFNNKTFKLEIIVIDLVPLSDGAAATIYKALLDSLNEKGIPMNNVIGFCADTCNVIFGANHSVVQMLLKDHPWIIPIKCSCHLIHLCASHPSRVFPNSVEDLCRNIFSHFNMSSKRSQAFKEFQQFLDLKEVKILRPGFTRWLSMKACVNRILQQYAALQLYFTDVVVEDPTHTHDSILAGLNNKFMQVYLEFMDFNLGKFVSFNLLFQKEMPQLHQLKWEVDSLIKAICLDFMDLEYVRSTDAMKINPSTKEKHLPLDKVYLGVLASDTMSKIKQERGSNDPDITLVYSQCQKFLIEAVLQIQLRFGDCHKVADLVACLLPSNAHTLKIPSLGGLYTKMPILRAVADLQKVDQEWRGHSMNPRLSDKLPAEEYWQVVFTERRLPDELARPNLVKVLKVLLSLPYSNAAVERVFSQLKMIKTDHRASLKQESLLALLTTKMTLLKSESSDVPATVKLQPSKEMLKLHKEMVTNADNDDVTQLRKDFMKKINIAST